MATASTDSYEDGLALGERVRAGEVRAAELVETAIERIEAYNPKLNAVVTKVYEQALEAARQQAATGPFAGVPFLLKDLGGALGGVPFSAGSRFFKDFCPPSDSELVRRYKASGLIPLGRTNTPEFGLNASTEPVLFGPTRNPWDTDRSSGGSSGGSAAAVAAGLVPACPCERRRRLDPHSRLLLRSVRHEDDPRPKHHGALSR